MSQSMRASVSRSVSGSSRTHFQHSKIAKRHIRRQSALAAAAKLTGDNWLPGSTRPAHLDGSLPGDNGFDPLNLGEIEANLIRAREAELIHGRYAMPGAAGCLAVELLGQGSWIDAPKWAVTGGVPEYLGVANPLLNLPAIALIQLVAMAYIELKRTAVDDVEKRLYPGGAFDPLGFAKDGGAKLTDLKEKEIANGRLAMVAMLGFFAQGDATKVGPLANLSQHLADPWAVNVATNGKSLPFP